MAAASFEEALRHVLVHEGGYSNHPSDPGGATNFGITIHNYRKYVKPGATAADVKAMKLDDAKAIYRSKYWDLMNCDRLPAGVDYAIFDYGVNSGPGRAGKVLRRLLNLSDATSAVTDEVIRMALQKEPGELCASICDERLRFLKSLRTWPVFGAGWARRVAEVKAASQAMAKNTVSAAPRSATPGKGEVAVDPAARKTTTAAVVVVGGAAAAEALHSGAMLAALAAAAMAILAAILAWKAFGAWQKNRQEAA